MANIKIEYECPQKVFGWKSQKKKYKNDILMTCASISAIK